MELINLRDLSQLLTAEVTERHADPPPTLYHYTTAAGLAGILRTKTLWATHAIFMNDRSEVEHGRSIAASLVQHALHLGAIGADAEFLGRLAERVNVPLRRTDTYVACFCRHGDLLSQWRGYANRGGGYSIGFASDTFGHPGVCGEHEVHLRRVEYGADKQTELLAAIIERCRQHLEKALTGAPPSMRPEPLTTVLVSVAERAILRAAVTFKDEGFREEQEWRVIVMRSHSVVDYSDEASPVKFREQAGILVPYVTLNFADVPHWRACANVRVGPTVDKRRAVVSLQMLLDQQGYRETNISSSPIPLIE
jgi:hypothetical protein